MLMLKEPIEDNGLLKNAPQFCRGQLIRHRRYGYRGVVVDFDMTCQASDAWYEKNQTQPGREQPWYHVLVDGSMTATYAAQKNLQPDSSVEPIDHPLVPFFFEGFKNGRYLRNERAWPSE